MSWVIFIIPSDDLAGRSGVAVTLFLSAVAFQFVVSSMIPKTSYNTAMDNFMFMTYIYSFAPLLESVIVFNLQKTGYNDIAQTFDYVAIPVFATTFAAFCIIFSYLGKRKITRTKASANLNLVNGSDQTD